ncbi:hypothetical protein Salat_1438500 [Sesamum alatum]|uniref:Uncharacterized protein n=1 Tax=Sesamum alatum TaxID=300844 RepID=A0AAE1YAM1_9LAMI|nr:hypothetical protein Salat_1438500 [Sesamum alatum]
MANSMEQSSDSSRQHDEPVFNLKEWALKARISRENTSSRRFSASNLRSFREDAKSSFRSNITISSSTASSPGYTLREEIDPSTYSFTTALKALQAKTVYTWEHLSPDGYTLNSKWNDAEKYICNPLSGEVPLECLSAKTLSGRSFRSVTSRITMSAPLIYSSEVQQFHANSPITEHETEVEVTSQGLKLFHSSSHELWEETGTMRDVGTQSTPGLVSSSSPSPADTPSIEERSIKVSEAEGGDSSPLSSGKLKSEIEVEERETREKQCTKRNGGGGGGGEEEEEEEEREKGGCLSLRGLWRRRVRQRDNHKPRTNNTTVPHHFLYHINACSKA